jgi:signal transduction histidine kinase
MSQKIQQWINSNDFLSSLFNNMNCAVFIVDRDVRIQNINRYFTTLFQKSENEVFNELCGNALGCVFPVREKTNCGKTVNCDECMLRKSLLRCFSEKGDALNAVIEREFYINNAPVLKYFNITTKYFKYDDLELVLVIIYDITDLESHKRRLEELNALKNEFLGIAAHDLRNPISEIMMASSLLSKYFERLKPNEKSDLLQIINKSSNFMLNLVNNLLDISKIEAGRIELDKTENDYIQFLEECLKLNRLFAKEKYITIDLLVDANIPPIRFDKVQIKQVLNNLLSNAIKFSAPQTKIIIKVEKTPNSLLTKVIDEGPGIPEQEISLLFKAFQRTSVQAPKGERSTGLGLAISKKIIEKHNGAIGVTSKVGKGSTFYFTLPLN